MYKKPVPNSWFWFHSDFIHNIQNIILYFRIRRSWSSHVGNWRCKISMFTKVAMDTYNVSLSGYLCPGYISWHEWWDTTALPSAKLHMKRILASSWLEYIVSTTCNHHTLNTQLLYTSPIKNWILSNTVLDWYHNCFNVVNDGNHQQEI
jgi:hypothetical protein